MSGRLVSVIIPTYNRLPRLREAVASVQAQTYREWEIIVVDDGSTDGTREALDSLDAVRWISQAHAGPATARNRGLGVARGSMIASLDSDDLWMPTFLEESVQAMEALGADLVFSNWATDTGDASYFTRWEESGRLAPFLSGACGRWRAVEPDALRRLFLASCLAPSSSLLIDRRMLRTGWNPKMWIGDDWYLLLDLVLRQRARAGLTTTPLWLKRTDGTNRYDGRSLARVISGLYVHDHGCFRRDFRPWLSPRERVRLGMRQTGYVALLDVARSLRDRWLT